MYKRLTAWAASSIEENDPYEELFCPEILFPCLFIFFCLLLVYILMRG